MYIRGDYLKKETKIKNIVSLPFELNHAITALYIQNIYVTLKCFALIHLWNKLWCKPRNAPQIVFCINVFTTVKEGLQCFDIQIRRHKQKSDQHALARQKIYKLKKSKY